MFSLIALFVAITSTPSADLTATLVPVAPAAATRFGRPAPQAVVLSDTVPASVKRPPDASGLKWGELVLGPASSLSRFAVALGEGDANLYVDVNSDGDLTNDAPISWSDAPVGTKPGAIHQADVQLSPANGSTIGIQMHRFDPAEAAARRLPANRIYAYATFCTEGKLQLNGTSYAIALLDAGSTGDFTYPGGRNGSMLLLIDSNGDGAFGNNERVPIRQTVRVGEKALSIRSISADGTSITFAEAAVPVAQAGGTPAAGQIAPAFEGPGLDGKPVKFPDDYKGKLVLIDFWATWCPPCVAEIPHIVKAYEKYHAKGLEVLGISFDHQGKADLLKEFTKSRKMPWRQVYEGKFWSTRIGAAWGIRGIPQMFLIDGDTGMIVASSRELRFGGLENTIEQALQKKGLGGKSAQKP